jgi:hypothetical protein
LTKILTIFAISFPPCQSCYLCLTNNFYHFKSKSQCLFTLIRALLVVSNDLVIRSNSKVTVKLSRNNINSYHFSFVDFTLSFKFIKIQYYILPSDVINVIILKISLTGNIETCNYHNYCFIVSWTIGCKMSYCLLLLLITSLKTFLIVQ